MTPEPNSRLGPNDSTFSLHPVHAANVPSLARLTDTACEDDRHTQLKALPEYGAYDHAATMRGLLTLWLQQPPQQCRLVQATDDTTGEPLGWVCWGFRGYEATPSTPSTPQPKPDNQTAASRPDPPHTGMARMNDVTNADLWRWMARLMPPGTKCVFIRSIVVAPGHRGKGVGAALVRSGTTQADADNVFCWVHSSEAGAAFFEKQGFEEVGRLDINLDEFAAEEDRKREKPVDTSEGGRRWGTYRFTYMKRMPREPQS